MLNQSLFTAQSGDYNLITSQLTLSNAQHFTGIYQALSDHASASINYPSQESYTLLDYVMQGIRVALPDIPLDAIATLKGLNLIACSDNVHIGLTALGYDYYQHIQV